MFLRGGGLACVLLAPSVMDDPHLSTATLAAVYAVLAAIDGLWLHLWCYRLHRTAPQEHRIHTARAVLFSAVVPLLLMGWASGPLLWCGALLAVADLALVAWDAAIETRTRAFQRGLPAGEAALHTVLQALHAVVLASAVMARPWSAWMPGGAAGPGPGAWSQALLVLVAAGSVLVAVVHLLLLRSSASVGGSPSGQRAETGCPTTTSPPQMPRGSERLPRCR